MNQTQAKLVLICGLPGAGKTTLAKKLENKLSATRFCPDEHMYKHKQDFFDEKARADTENTMWQEAKVLLTKGRTVILEYGFWSRRERDEKRQDAQDLGVEVELYFLDVSLEELWYRLQDRNQPGNWQAVDITFDQLKEWAGIFQAPGQNEIQQYDKYFHLN